LTSLKEQISLFPIKTNNIRIMGDRLKYLSFPDDVVSQDRVETPKKWFSVSRFPVPPVISSVPEKPESYKEKVAALDIQLTGVAWIVWDKSSPPDSIKKSFQKILSEIKKGYN
jgi:hypothetical protein